MGLIDSAIDAFRFKDTIFYKENSDLQNKYDALKKLQEEYPNRKRNSISIKESTYWYVCFKGY